MDYPTQNDINRITKVVEMLSNIKKFEFQTEIGKEFGDQIKQSLEEIIKPYGRECILKLKQQSK